MDSVLIDEKVDESHNEICLSDILENCHAHPNHHHMQRDQLAFPLKVG